MASPDRHSNTRPLRVLRVIASLDPAVGGPAESSVNSCIAAQRAGVETTVLVPVTCQAAGIVEPVIRRLRGEGVTVRTFRVTPDRSYYSHRWAISLGLIAWLGRHLREYDVLHVHATWGLSQLCGVLLATALQRPCVVTPHEGLTSFDLEPLRPSLRSLAKKVAKKFYLKRPTLIVFSSRLEAKDSLPSPPLGHTVVLAHPLRDALEVPRTESPERPRATRIGFLGRLHEKKNLDVLMRAVDAVSDEAQLIIAGDGPRRYREQLQKLAIDLDIAQRVEWLGFVEGSRKWRFLDGIDILVMPSRYECFGMAAAEAMARGTATIVSSETGIAELVRASDGGLTAPPTVSGISIALAELVYDPARLTEVAIHGARAAESVLSLDAHGTAIRRHYENLVELSRRSLERSPRVPSA